MVPSVAEVEIRDLALDEASIAADFFHQQWRPNHIFFRNRAVLLWQYYDNPLTRQFSQGMTFRAAFENSKLVGTYGYMPFIFNRYGAREFGCYLSAYWVDELHRRGPLPLRLLFSLQKQSPFQACVGGLNTAIAERIYESLSWVVLHNTPRLIYILDREQFGRLLAPGRHAPEPTRAAGTGGPTATSERGIEVTVLNAFAGLNDDGWDEFFWTRLALGMIGPAREAAYLDWRYQRVPIFHYDALLARRDGAAAGLLVYRVEQIRDSEVRVIRLVDVAAESDAIPPLVESLLSAARRHQAACVDFFGTHPAYLTRLAKCGFINACEPSGERYWFPYLFQPLDHERLSMNCSWWIRGLDLSSPAARSDFNLMKGDYEFDRPN